ncbi:hypothetical protein Tco_0499286 [Tanacetum coccineum]
MRIKESLNVTFDESLPKPKLSPSIEDDRIIEPIVQNPIRSPSLEANASEPGYPNSLKEARGHPIEQVIGELNERTLRTYGKDMEVKQHCCFNEMKDRCQCILQTMVDITVGRSSLRSKGTLMSRRQSLRFRVRSGSARGSTSSELDARVRIQGDNVFRKKNV